MSFASTAEVPCSEQWPRRRLLSGLEAPRQPMQLWGSVHLSTTRGVVNRITLGGTTRELCLQVSRVWSSLAAGRLDVVMVYGGR
mgnify:CR=1 FL=1